MESNLIPEFNEFLNEGKVVISKMEFTISSFVDNKGLAIQFLPSNKTLDKFSTNEMVEKIKGVLAKNVTDLRDLLYFEINNGAAGLVFRLDQYGLAEMIERKLR
jgi:hypothetical protein